MEIKETIINALKELILPELENLKKDATETRVSLQGISKRLDDINIHLADQSRRIDAVREELGNRIDETNNRIDETNKRIDRLYEVIVRREEHNGLQVRVAAMEKDIAWLKERIAA